VCKSGQITEAGHCRIQRDLSGLADAECDAVAQQRGFDIRFGFDWLALMTYVTAVTQEAERN
jgi:hypothetical protein